MLEVQEEVAALGISSVYSSSHLKLVRSVVFARVEQVKAGIYDVPNDSWRLNCILSASCVKILSLEAILAVGVDHDLTS